MEFTEPFSYSHGQVRLSPNGHHIATLNRSSNGATLNLSIQITLNGATAASYCLPSDDCAKYNHLLPKTERIELLWSPNSQLIAVVFYKTSRVHIYDVDLDISTPLCSVQESALIGIDRAVWSPDARHLLCFLRHRMGVRVWALDSRHPRMTLPCPKHGNSPKGLAFSEDGRWMALLHRSGKDLQDYIYVYDCSPEGNFKAVQSLRCPESSCFLDDICFAPFMEGHNQMRAPIMAWESAAFSDRVFIFYPDGITTKVLSVTATRASMDNGASLKALGAESVVWCKTTGIAAVIHDSLGISLWNATIQRMGPCITLGYSCFVEGETIVFRERITKEVATDGSVLERSKYESGFSLSLPALSSANNSNRQMSSVLFSPDGSYLAVVSDDYPMHVFIFRVADLTASAVLHQATSIKEICWHDQGNVLCVICEGVNNIYVWQPTGCLSIPQPSINGAKAIQWAPHCDTLLISGPSNFCLAVPDWASY